MGETQTTVPDGHTVTVSSPAELYAKTFTGLCVVGCTTFLGYAGVISGDAVIGILGVVGGWSVANFKTARRPSA